MTYQTILEWEAEHETIYPDWALCWFYCAYGEAWEVIRWGDVKSSYEEERKIKLDYSNRAGWDYDYEPIVANPLLKKPKSSYGKLLKRFV